MKIDQFKDSPEFSIENWQAEQKDADTVAYFKYHQKHSNEPTLLKPETLLDFERFNNYNILRLLLDCTIKLSEGAHTKTFQFDKDKLQLKLQNIAFMYESQITSLPKEKNLEELAQYIADKFVLKVGRTEDFTMALTTDEQDPNSIDRGMMADTFAEAGYNILPTSNEINSQTQDATTVLPFFGNADEMQEIFVPGLIREFFLNNCDLSLVKNRRHQGQALISDLRGGRLYSIFSLFKNLSEENPWRRGLPEFEGIEDMESLKAAQKELRNGLMKDSEFLTQLKRHFNQVSSLGYRPLMRRLKGEKKSQITLNAIIDALSIATYQTRDENYIVDESTYAAPIPDEITPDLVDNNVKTIECFKIQVEKLIPKGLLRKIPEDSLRLLVSAVLNYHHDLPDFKVDEDVGIISGSTAKLVVKAISNLGRIAAAKTASKLPESVFKSVLQEKAKLPEKRNTDFKGFIMNDPLITQTLSGLNDQCKTFFIEVIEKIFTDYMREGGIKDENHTLRQYERVPSTFYLFQSRIAPEHDELPEECEVMTLKDLIENHEEYLNEYPDLVLKLLNYYAIILNYLFSTRLLLDVRHSDVGKDLFIFGKWGLTTENILIKIDKKTKKTQVVHIDLRDQFVHFDPKLYKKSKGVAKHGLHIIMEVFPEAIFNNIAYLTEKFYENRGEEVPINDYSTPEKAARWVHSNVSQLFNNAKRFTEAFIEQEVHDTERLKDRLKDKFFKK